MSNNERRYYWSLIGSLLIANSVLLLAVWFVGVDQRRDCEHSGVTILDGRTFNCEVQQ